jgi:hypothetical protein
MKGKKLSDNLELVIDGPLLILIPEDLYDATVTNIEIVTRFKRPMVAMTFRLATDPYVGRELLSHAALNENGKPARASKLSRWWRLITDFDPRRRPDRMTMKAFQTFLFQVSVGTVKKNHQHQDIPMSRWYSCVQEIIAVVGRVSDSDGYISSLSFSSRPNSAHSGSPHPAG